MKKTFVTKPFLPPLDEYYDSLKVIWRNGVLTNNGPFNEKFERALSNFLGLPFVSLVNNATSGLMIAIKALELKNEVITTRFFIYCHY